MSLFAVLLADPAASPPGAAAFLAARGGDPDVAHLFVRANPGFLGRGLPREKALELAAEAAAAGLPCRIFGEAELPALPRAVEAERAVLRHDGIEAFTPLERAFLPFDSVAALHCAAWEAREAPDTLPALKAGAAAGLGALAGAPLPPRAPAPLETFFRADLVGGKEPFRLVLRPERLAFGGLEPLSRSSLENFRALLSAAAAASFGAAANAFVPAFLGSRQLAPFKCAGPEAADLSLARLLLLARRAP